MICAVSKFGHVSIDIDQVEGDWLTWIILWCNLGEIIIKNRKVSWQQESIVKWREIKKKLSRK